MNVKLAMALRYDTLRREAERCTQNMLDLAPPGMPEVEGVRWFIRGFLEAKADYAEASPFAIFTSKEGTRLVVALQDAMPIMNENPPPL
ncbi:hypothetical protein [Paracraurococcus lichenis]|uniref:Uncharacterized protein n=1 Tax=Paracraurococcus lichenis TaxID=3064888 RepID=A0ABT9ECU7_9PROT|nr:hypothetical protein [Paracraurococcus sp. LOR1-02]MDO9714047.1 hypothetical protein [Paracraurococcus sp. LOR1-02]